MPYFHIANAILSIERRAGAQLARIKVPSLFVKLLKHSAIVSYLMIACLHISVSILRTKIQKVKYFTTIGAFLSSSAVTKK